ncbi:bifunctional pyr operon transcriptional regulator/uracil phosphoribosyltransferase PyrR [Massiliimalia timonensis]|uniref:bifunctional pyr operon transcriptional regulator/uracil phosphoribosyltransferase PyrR n=1 Tax=Massiliimalia timonensis TaxID=1987501 RepID=UPI00227731E9|nr:bifunctional pyr operon transcriptional regulator/uracil phosphoribosyltransferase PyrR [Massiliimalia timonensis]
MEPSHGKEVQQVERKLILDEKAMERAIARISYEIIERNKGADELCVVGILSRGAELAGRIAGKISQIENKRVPCGVLDITAFRDDSKKETAGDDQTDLPFPIEGKRVVLVDDVIYTGRSARSAMEAVMKRGRAKAIQLAALVDRGHRELPIRADFIGKNLPTSKQETVQVLVKERDGINSVYILSE